MWYNFCVFSSGKCCYISKCVPVCVTTGVFGVVVFFILAYLVVLLQVYGRRSCKFLVFFYVWVAPPVPLSSGLGWLPVSRLGFAHPGLTSGGGLLFLWVTFLVARPFFLPRPLGLNPVGVSPLFLLLFCVFLSWLCAHSAAQSVWMFHS